MVWWKRIIEAASMLVVVFFCVGSHIICYEKRSRRATEILRPSSILHISCIQYYVLFVILSLLFIIHANNFRDGGVGQSTT